MNRAAWDGADEGCFEASDDPDWHERYQNGETDFDETEIRLLGDVSGLNILQLSCSDDASQALSLAVLGARVTVCDFSPAAIDIARENAQKAGLDLRFVVDDSQRLAAFRDDQFDLVHADLGLWCCEDLITSCRNWSRILRPGGRLLLREEYPFRTDLLNAVFQAGLIAETFAERTEENLQGAAGSGLPCDLLLVARKQGQVPQVNHD